ncbi:hypothetical protein TL16_g06486 [Triparma laevis f. inornata]|uniref:Casein kinase substrate phosphoprotein PP28 domain-containing protein n=1 Tax=Triparma laevis f. inornata TaxID=1714386 RepID=A0A9W7ANN9_9STRA|nr:hypothetical protein TL16_g06486 [Triparma laevis f. inornata]
MGRILLPISVPTYLLNPPNPSGKGNKRGGRGGNQKFAAQSAEEIEIRNARLAEFDAQRQQRRAEAEGEDEDGGGDGGDDNKAGDDAGDSAARQQMELGRKMAGMDMSEGGEEEVRVKKIKGTGFASQNPNDVKEVHGIKLKDLKNAPPQSRKEREAAEKEAAAERYRKRHEQGLTEEYKKDMEKLNEVKRRRAVAEAKAAEKKKMEEVRRWRA